MVCLLGISVLIISASPGRIYIWNYASQNRLFSAVRVNFALMRTLFYSDDSRFVPGQWERVLLCNDVSLAERKPRISPALSFIVLVSTRQIWGIWKLRPAYSPETPNLGQNLWCFVPCDLEICWMTLENKREPLLCCFKLCATFHSHWWIQTGVTVRNAQFGSNSTIFRAVWPWNLTDDLEKQ